MTEKLHLRCSSLPIAFRCPGSVRTGPLVIDEANEAGAMGTAAHEAHAHMVTHGLVDWDGVAELARRHDVDAGELRSLLGLGQLLWEQVNVSFPNASAEVSMAHADDDFVLTGTADVIGISAGVAHIGDWKDGRVDSDYAQQLLGYAFLALASHPELERAEAGILWVRETEYEHHSMTVEQASHWLARLRAEVVKWDGTFRPGNHCAHCRRAHECPARRAIVRRDVEAIAGMNLDEQAIAALTPAQRIDLVIKARAVAQIAERFIGAIKADVAKNGAVNADGKTLTLMKSERRSVRAWEAFPVLQERLDDSEMAQVTTISLSKAEELVRKKAPPRKGAQAVRELNMALEEASAIATSESVSLVVRRTHD